MKTFLIIAYILLFNLASNAQTGQIKVRINDISVKDKGTIRIDIFTADGFPQPEKAVFRKELSVSAKETAVTFDNIPVGEYAITVFQDINNDGELNMGTFGPTEPNGFSLNKRGKLGLPKFKDVSFQVNDGKCINLIINFK